MRDNYILIDLENVQPKNLSYLQNHNFKVLVFVGENQSKISFDLVHAIQLLGDNAQYIKINGNGPNALDFHISFYIGELATKNQNTFFHIISKDTGFDPLIRHLKDKKIHVQRHADITTIPLLKVIQLTTVVEKVDAIIEFLKSRGNAKPRTIKTLTNSINSLFANTLQEEETVQLLNELLKRKVIAENGNKITYKIPK